MRLTRRKLTKALLGLPVVGAAAVKAATEPEPVPVPARTISREQLDWMWPPSPRITAMEQDDDGNVTIHYEDGHADTFALPAQQYAEAVRMHQAWVRAARQRALGVGDNITLDGKPFVVKDVITGESL